MKALAFFLALGMTSAAGAASAQQNPPLNLTVRCDVWWESEKPVPTAVLCTIEDSPETFPPNSDPVSSPAGLPGLKGSRQLHLEEHNKKAAGFPAAFVSKSR